MNQSSLFLIANNGDQAHIFVEREAVSRTTPVVWSEKPLVDLFRQKLVLVRLSGQSEVLTGTRLRSVQCHENHVG